MILANDMYIPHAVEIDGQVVKVYDEINQLEKSEIEIQTFHRYQELAAWLLIPAILLLLVEILVRKTILRQIP